MANLFYNTGKDGVWGFQDFDNGKSFATDLNVSLVTL